MKNVQYYLKKINKRELAEAYFDKYLMRKPEYFKDRKNKFNKMTLSKYYQYCIKNIEKYIERLCKLKTIDLSNENQLVIIRDDNFTFDDDYNYSDFGAYKYTDVFSDKKYIEKYDYTFNHQDEIMSYLVADTFVNKSHMVDLLIDILHEASFFGYGEKHDEKVDKKIEQMKKDIDEKNFIKLKKSDLDKFLGYSNKYIKEKKKYDKRYEVINNKYYKHRRNFYKEKEMFQVDEVRKKYVVKEDFLREF